jgi:hypothetical protein
MDHPVPQKLDSKVAKEESERLGESPMLRIKELGD